MYPACSAQNGGIVLAVLEGQGAADLIAIEVYAALGVKDLLLDEADLQAPASREAEEQGTGSGGGGRAARQEEGNGIDGWRRKDWLRQTGQLAGIARIARGDGCRRIEDRNAHVNHRTSLCLTNGS